MLVNPLTQKALQHFADNPSHALLLVGNQYSGADALVNTVIEMLKTHHTVTHRQIVPSGTGIAIDVVRELRNEEKLKTSRSYGSIASIISIVPIDAMQHEAQNALLKLLEEPPVGTLFILVCHDESQMLGTIASRCKRVTVLPISKKQALQQYGSEPQLDQLYLMSNGEALLLELLIQDPNHSVMLSIQNTKQLLRVTLAERLSAVDGILKAQKTYDTLDALERICKAALQVSGSAQSVWAQNLKETLHAQHLLQAKVQPKLVLTNLFCRLSA